MPICRVHPLIGIAVEALRAASARPTMLSQVFYGLSQYRQDQPLLRAATDATAAEVVELDRKDSHRLGGYARCTSGRPVIRSHRSCRRSILSHHKTSLSVLALRVFGRAARANFALAQRVTRTRWVRLLEVLQPPMSQGSALMQREINVLGTCGRRHFYGPLPDGSLQASKSDRLLAPAAGVISMARSEGRCGLPSPTGC